MQFILDTFAVLLALFAGIFFHIHLGLFRKHREPLSLLAAAILLWLSLTYWAYIFGLYDAPGHVGRPLFPIILALWAYDKTGGQWLNYFTHSFRWVRKILGHWPLIISLGALFLAFWIMFRQPRAEQHWDELAERLETQNEKLTKRHAETVKELDRRIDKLQDEVNRTREELAATRKELDNAATELIQRQKEINGLRTGLRKRDEEVERLEATVNDQQRQITEQYDYIKLLRQAIKDMGGQPPEMRPNSD